MEGPNKTICTLMRPDISATLRGTEILAPSGGTRNTVEEEVVVVVVVLVFLALG